MKYRERIVTSCVWFASALGGCSSGDGGSESENTGGDMGGAGGSTSMTAGGNTASTTAGGTSAGGAGGSGGAGGTGGEATDASGGSSAAGGSGGSTSGGASGGSAGSTSSSGGSSTTDSTTVGGAGGTGGTGGSPNGTPFVPEGIEVNYVGQGDSAGLEIVAFTLLQSAGILELPSWFVAVRNGGADPVCLVDVPSEFYDADGNLLADSPGGGAASSPLYDSFGSATPCLGNGDVGMLAVTSGLSALDVSLVTRIDHGFVGNINPDATLLDVSVENVVFTEDSFGTVATGDVVNGTTSVLDFPEVAIYPLDPAGRPLGIMSDIADTTIPGGGSWSFETLSFDGTVADYAAFADADFE